MDTFFYRVASLTFNESIKNEFEDKVNNSSIKKLGAKIDLNEINLKGIFLPFKV